jgi:hypothetical protein
MSKQPREWANCLIAVPKSMEAQSPFTRLMYAERRAADAEQAQTVAERETQRQAHLIGMMLDQLGGSITITADTMREFDAHRTIQTQVNLDENSLRVWVTGGV